ncbi:MAG: amino acid carrier protein [Oscillospiraceae bacterium]|jgi:AGCS family alanine or glycine:cation symporter|nr:amino acid carrier protein [Oscillospiraceae bacterium]
MLSTIATALWSAPTLAAFLCVGFWFSAKTRFFQFTHMGAWMRETFGSLLKKGSATTDAHTIRPFQALTAALAACMGTGNIAGVATALVLGGPGAIFWMLISSILSQMTAFAENALGIRYRYKSARGDYVGGTMVTLARGLHMPGLGRVHCVLLLLASFGVGNMTQGNSAAAALQESFGLAPLAVGIALAALTAAVAAGGIKRLATVTEWIIPLLSGLFILACVVIIVHNGRALPGVFAQIGRGIWNRDAMRWGIARGVFSNEAGLGTAPLIHAAANCKKPAQQGFWGIAEVFIDTTLMCTVTGVTLLASGVYAPTGTRTGAGLCADAFATLFGTAGRHFVSISLCLYAFTTLIGWGQYGRSAARYLSGKPWLERVYLAVFVAAVVIGCVARLDTVWLLADIFNALMAIPSLLSLVLLRREALAEFRGQRREGRF